jgi:hypothetical protein
MHAADPSAVAVPICLNVRVRLRFQRINVFIALDSFHRDEIVRPCDSDLASGEARRDGRAGDVDYRARRRTGNQRALVARQQVPCKRIAWTKHESAAGPYAAALRAMGEPMVNESFSFEPNARAVTRARGSEIVVSGIGGKHRVDSFCLVFCKKAPYAMMA